MRDSSENKLPKGWELKKMEEVCDMYQPKTISKKEMIADGEFPVFGANGIIGRYSKYNHEEPQLLITCRGATCGSINLSEPYSWINGNAMVVRPFDNSLILDFIKYLFQGFIDISKVISGAAQPQITRQSLNPVKIPIPPLPEQKQIVKILDEAFEAIDKAKANIEKNIVNANELFQSKLNAIFSQKGEGWEETTLKKVCEITSKLVNPEESKYIDLIHVGGGNIEAETGKLINLKTAREEELKSGKFKFNSTMVLYNKIRPYLVKVTRPEFNGLCSADMYPLVPIKDEITRDFLYYLLISKNFTDYAISGSSRAGMPKVNRKHLFDYQFSIASLEKQKKLTKELELLRTEYMSITSFYNQKLTSLEELKKSILQKAFSGELTN